MTGTRTLLLMPRQPKVPENCEQLLRFTGIVVGLPQLTQKDVCHKHMVVVCVLEANVFDRFLACLRVSGASFVSRDCFRVLERSECFIFDSARSILIRCM